MTAENERSARRGADGGGRGRDRSKRTAEAQRVKSFVGKWKYRVSDVAKEFLKLALDDEKAGRTLMENGHHRQAIYFFVQAMEKLVRFGIFSEVAVSQSGRDGQTFRERTLTHDLDELLGVLLEVFTDAINDPRVSQQIEEQLRTYVLEGERFGQLHNNIRYPRYMWKSGDFSVLQLSKDDVSKVVQKLERLKSFVAGFNRLRGGTSPLDEHMGGDGQPQRATEPARTAETTQSSDTGRPSVDKLADFRF